MDPKCSSGTAEAFSKDGDLLTSTDRGIMEATAAQHSGLAKGEPARFVRNGVLRTCQCRECSAMTSTEGK